MRPLSSLRQPLAGALLLLLVVTLVYLPALHGGFLWDDHDWIVENALLRSAEGLGRIWLEPRAFHQYYPLTHSSFWLEFQLWGLQPTGYHAVNLVLHALTAFLLWRVLRGLELGGAFAAALLFALHPVAVESVAWITERKNLLSAALAMASLLLALPYVHQAEPRTLGRRQFAAATAFFLLALLAKTAVCTLPGLLLLLRWWTQGRLKARDLVPLLPWFGASLALGAGTAWLERVEVGAQGEAWALGPLERVLVAGRALWFYAGKLLVPRQLSFIYPRWALDAGQLLQWAYPLAALALLVGLFAARARLGRGPFVAAAAFAGLLCPTLGFLDIYAQRFSFVADHWAYHAAPAFFAALVHGASRLLVRAPRALGLGLGLLLALGLGYRSRQQATFYADPEQLYRHTLALNPDSAMVHANLAVLLMDRGADDDALVHLEQAYRLDPRDPVIAMDLGMALDLAGRDAEAAAHYTRMLAAEPTAPVVLNALADLLARSRDPQVRDPARAVALAEQALALASPAPSEVWATLAQAYAAAGRRTEARAAARQGLDRARAEGNAAMTEVFEAWLGG